MYMPYEENKILKPCEKCGICYKPEDLNNGLCKKCNE